MIPTSEEVLEWLCRKPRASGDDPRRTFTMWLATM